MIKDRAARFSVVDQSFVLGSGRFVSGSLHPADPPMMWMLMRVNLVSWMFVPNATRQILFALEFSAKGVWSLNTGNAPCVRIAVWQLHGPARTAHKPNVWLHLIQPSWLRVFVPTMLQVHDTVDHVECQSCSWTTTPTMLHDNFSECEFDAESVPKTTITQRIEGEAELLSPVCGVLHDASAFR